MRIAASISSLHCLEFLSRHSTQFTTPVRSRLYDIYVSVYTPLQGGVLLTYECAYCLAGVVNHKPVAMTIDANGATDNYSVFTGNTYTGYEDAEDDLPDAAPQLKNIRSCSSYRSSFQQQPVAAPPLYVTPAAMFANGKTHTNNGDTYGCFEARPSLDAEEVSLFTLKLADGACRFRL